MCNHLHVEDDSDRKPVRATIVSVMGRQAQGGGRGLPKLSEIELEDENGLITRAAVIPNTPGRRTGDAVVLEALKRVNFEVCPICIDQPADSAEHVPPKGLGGSLMTTTCTRCNNAFGTLVEAGLQDWFDRMVYIRYTADGDPRPFGATRALVLRTDEGTPIVLPERGSDPGEEFSQRMRTAKHVSQHVLQPNMALVRNAILKSAYLAACVHLQKIPSVDSAVQIRAELLKVVSTTSRAQVETGPHAQRLRFFRTGKPAGLALALLRNKTVESGPAWLLSLAGTVVVEWPFPEIDPTTRRAAASPQDPHRAE